MALINALFPPAVHLEDSEDFDPTPYSPGLRDNIRFSLYEFLMGDDPFSEKQQEAIRMKLLRWCDILDYEKSRDALMRYMQEARKLEEVCLKGLDSAERHSTALSEPTSLSTSMNTTSDGSFSPDLDPSFSSHRTIGSMAYNPRNSGSSSHRVLSAPPVPNGLLAGVPGREILGAQTDMAAFAGGLSNSQSDTSLPSLLATEFDQHPLARDLDMSSTEKAILGLLIPKELSSCSL